jgi:hypothetical protein
MLISNCNLSKLFYGKIIADGAAFFHGQREQPMEQKSSKKRLQMKKPFVIL